MLVRSGLRAGGPGRKEEGRGTLWLGLAPQMIYDVPADSGGFHAPARASVVI